MNIVKIYCENWTLSDNMCVFDTIHIHVHVGSIVSRQRRCLARGTGGSEHGQGAHMSITARGPDTKTFSIR